MMTSNAQLRSATIWPQVAWVEPTEPRVRRSAPTVALRAVIPSTRQTCPVGVAEQAIDREVLRRGGRAYGDELLGLVRTHCDQPISRVARWIVGREVLQYRLGLEAVFPLFQFDLLDMSVLPAVRQVIAELSSMSDDVELADWFVRPHSLLDGALPADVLERDPLAVIDAARADRFVMRG